jgi:hypothetical protein
MSTPQPMRRLPGHQKNMHVYKSAALAIYAASRAEPFKRIPYYAVQNTQFTVFTIIPESGAVSSAL